MQLVWRILSMLVPNDYSGPIGPVPESHQVGKWRLIVDLSAQHAHSVNDGIASSVCSLAYFHNRLQQLCQY